MSKRQMLIVVGALIIVMPFLGFPTNVDSIIYVVLGLIVIFMSYKLIPTKRKEETPTSLPFLEKKNINSELPKTES